MNREGFLPQLTNPASSFLGRFLVWTCGAQQWRLHTRGHRSQAGIGMQRAEASEPCDQVGELVCLQSPGKSDAEL